MPFNIQVNQLIMHSQIYIAICAASVGSVLCFGTPKVSSMVFGAALAVALLGVPHGGLDHWTGRRLLHQRFGSTWWMIFFPVYLLVSCLFAFGWFVFPITTVVLFFFISAWHFGREDQHATASRSARLQRQFAFDHVSAAAVGGLVIWIPSLVRPEEMQSLLHLIVPGNGFESAGLIVDVTQVIAVLAIPLASLTLLRRLIQTPRDCERWTPLATAAVAVSMPILISFTIYFCFWHSWLGLQRLRRAESLTIPQFARSIAPLSVVAIIGIALSGWWLQGSAAEVALQGQTSLLLQALFIGLSAIAVPHLFLHELDSRLSRSHSHALVCT